MMYLQVLIKIFQAGIILKKIKVSIVDGHVITFAR
ncbi:hypothetical protein BCL90_4711 [Pedobacter alluvionis]|uniref:Uncharacterized protein n=1 Tax=Pedobacter alluvionis TaxID=475253 RepID=A0A497XU38_9SPHI|nr:hypothetical protein BCL90_4711 [Pedobacter alluvionis]